jgi:uncharacterized protein Yka (UPF0111/DUF47 family)
MFSIQKLLGKEDRFFDLLEASAREAHSCVEAVAKLVHENPAKPDLEPFIQSRHTNKKIREQIGAQLLTSFVASLEREDIECLSTALYKIPKTVEKFVERYALAPQFIRKVDFSPQINLITESTGIVLVMIQKLRGNLNLQELKDLNSQLQVIEGKADKIMLQLLGDLLSGKYDPLHVVVLKDLYELLEKVADRCRDAGQVVSQIVLKNS